MQIKPIEKVIEERQVRWLGHMFIRCEKQVKQEVAEQRKIKWNETKTLAQDRENWKRVIIC